MENRLLLYNPPELFERRSKMDKCYAHRRRCIVVSSPHTPGVSPQGSEICETDLFREGKDVQALREVNKADVDSGPEMALLFQARS
jgi:hypothetical protein